MDLHLWFEEDLGAMVLFENTMKTILLSFNVLMVNEKETSGGRNDAATARHLPRFVQRQRKIHFLTCRRHFAFLYTIKC